MYRTFVSEVITGYLPSLILQQFQRFVPPIMIMLSSVQGYNSFSQIQKSACFKFLWFTIWNIFFANVLSGSALYRVNVFLEPKEIPLVLAEAVPGQVRIFLLLNWTFLKSICGSCIICEYWLHILYITLNVHLLVSEPWFLYNLWILMAYLVYSAQCISVNIWTSRCT